MQCLDESSVVAFFERSLSSDAMAQVDEHVATCIACHDLLAVFAEVYPAANDGSLASAFGPTTPAGAGESGSVVGGDVAIGRHLARVQAHRRVGTELAGRWTLERVLGVGGMGQVFAAKHRNGKRAAIEILRPELSGAPSVVKRFVQEGYAANRVGHPGALSVLDDGVATDGSIFLVMDLLDGETLKDRLSRAGPLSVGDVLRYTNEVLDVLAAAHAQGIVHRDIKPENLFVTTENAVRVLDFGIARVRELSGEGGSTESGVSMGTPAFMPPEQARGQSSRVDARADLWAVGATMFTLLTGETVREGNNAREELFVAMTRPVRSLASVMPGLPAGVAAVVDRALAFEPEDRWPDAASMKKALLDAVSESPKPPVPRARSPRPMIVTFAVGTVALGGVVAAAFLSGEAPSTTTTLPTPTASPDTTPTATATPAANANTTAEPTVTATATAISPTRATPSPAPTVRTRPPTPAVVLPTSPPRSTSPLPSTVPTPSAAPTPPADPPDPLARHH